MEETKRVLKTAKFGLTPNETRVLTKPLFDIAEIITPNAKVNIISRCPADNRVLECAVDGFCSFIVSGDRQDLLSLVHYQDIEIIKARDFLGRI